MRRSWVKSTSRPLVAVRRSWSLRAEPDRRPVPQHRRAGRRCRTGRIRSRRRVPDAAVSVFPDATRLQDTGTPHVALTAPYQHDGSEATLDEVVRFYNLGGRDARSYGKALDIKP